MNQAALETVASEHALSRAEQKASPLYAGRVEVYAKAVRGRFRTIKWAALVALLGLYYLAPWLRWDRGPDAPGQAILADFATRRLYFFWIEIWPQQIYFLTGVLILAAFGLFLATALFGRLWCGFTCPQTVWTDLFMTVERWIEGDRNERMRFDKLPWSAEKIRRRATKHAVWILIAAATGGAWIMYFVDAPTVIRTILTGQASLPVYFFFGLFTATTYLLAGFAREQVCTYMCPWPRIQGALVDRDTMAVTYERWRGEPRGKHKRGEAWEGRGDCVDCKQCVAVCPMGIDIRDGFQLECIGCGLCVDACNDVMDKVGRPPMLIAYDSERNQALRAAGQPARSRILRPRTVLYAGVVSAVGAVMLTAFLLRGDTDVNVLPDRNPLFVTLADGSIRNGYTFKVINMEHVERDYTLRVVEPETAKLWSDASDVPGATATLTVPPDTVGSYRVFVRLPADEVGPSGQRQIEFALSDGSLGGASTYDTVFNGPRR